jgi:restriction system protein
MTDAELRGKLLKSFYSRRHNADGWAPTSDIDVSGGEFVGRQVIAGVCRQLQDGKLIEWRPLTGAQEGLIIGYARITALGVDVIEGRTLPPIAVDFIQPTARGIDMYAALLADARKLGPDEAALVEALGRDRAEQLLLEAIRNQQVSSFVTDSRGNKKIPRTFFDLIEGELKSARNVGLLRSDALLRTVVIPERGVDAGRLVEAVALPWFDIVSLLQREQNAAYDIPPEKWEEIIAGAYKNAGYEEVILTPRSGDFGRDVIAVKKGIGRIRVIDQVKAYKPPHLVNANDVRALIGVLQSDGASKAFLTTTSDFAPRIREDPLIKPWIPSRLDLVGRSDLFNRLAEIAARAKGLIIHA